MEWIALAFVAVAAFIWFDEWVQARHSKKLRDWLDKDREP